MSDTTNTDVVKTGFRANEPVIVGHAVLWLLANLGAFVVAHSHNLLSLSQWQSFSTGWAPYITAGVLSISAFLTRKYVSPAWKKVQNVAAQQGFPLPSAEEIDLLAEKVYEAFLDKQAAAASVAPAPELLAQQVPAHAGHDGVIDPDYTPPVNPLP